MSVPAEWAASAEAIVIGGGLAGLTAARELRAAGRSVILLEARNRLGGRTWYRYFDAADRSVELGGTHFSRRHHPWVAAEIERYGLSVEPRHNEGIAFRWKLDSAPPGAFPLNGDEIEELERAIFETTRVARRIDPDQPRDGQHLEEFDVPFDRFVLSLNLPTRVRNLFYAWGSLGVGAGVSEWSVLASLSWIAAQNASVYAYLLTAGERLRDGTSGLVEALATESDFDVRFESPVVEIKQLDDRVAVRTAAGSEYSGTVAIVAIPVNTLAGVRFDPALHPGKQEIIAAGHPGRLRKIWMLAENVPPELGVISWDTEFIWLAPVASLGEAALLYGVLSPTSSVDPNDTASLGAAVSELLAGASVVASTWHDWLQDPYSKGTWMSYRPGVLSRLHSEISRQENRVIFAGADVAVRWIGWLDGAVGTGMQAARDAMVLTKR